MAHAGQWLAVLRRDNTLQLYDALRLDCGVPAERHIQIPDGITFKSSTAFSATGDRIAVTSASGSTYIYQVGIHSSALHSSAKAIACIVNHYMIDPGTHSHMLAG